MSTLWKQNTPLHPSFARINRCLEEDWFLLPHELKLQHAHLAALAKAEILKNEERLAIEAALAAIAARFENAPCPNSDAEDLHTWVEWAVVETAGEVGKKLHTARSRNDQVATLLKMYVVDSSGRINTGLGKLIEICCRKADAWSELVAPMQTHAQFAAPGTIGFWILRFATAFDRIRLSLQSLRQQWQTYCPLGAAAVVGSSIPIDRAVQAEGLGFRMPSPNALDATSSRDECLQLLAIISQLGLHFQTFATDVLSFCQTPMGWVEYPEAFGTGSSMMPNKANPDAMELLRGLCCGLHAAYLELLMQLKGLPSGYNRDLQCCKPVIRKSVEAVLDLIELMSRFVDALSFHEQQLTHSLALGHLGATLAMEESVKRGHALRDAHHAVAGALPQDQVGLTDVYRYKTVGSANPDETRRIAREIREALGESAT